MNLTRKIAACSGKIYILSKPLPKNSIPLSTKTMSALDLELKTPQEVATKSLSSPKILTLPADISEMSPAPAPAPAPTPTPLVSEEKEADDDSTTNTNNQLNQTMNARKRKEYSDSSSGCSKPHKKVKGDTKNANRVVGFPDSCYDETSYYFENGLRKVYPYYYKFKTYAKGRWVGERLLDVFAREFRAHCADEYKRSIESGALMVNGKQVPVDYILDNNDLLENVVHRHEVPVANTPIEFIHRDDDIVAINKPASIPVHPCGRYRHNSIIFILAKEYDMKNLRTLHRLDRLTSGVLLFSRSSRKAQEMELQIRSRLVEKVYVCLVEGDFPDGVVECKEPVDVISHKIGVCKVSAKGKESTTVFEKLNYNESSHSSVVLCKPVTGRMHQIRVHLQYLGYPIVNDPLYNHPVFGPGKGKGGDFGGRSDSQLIEDLIKIHNAENWLGTNGKDAAKLKEAFVAGEGDLGRDDDNAPILTVPVDDDSKRGSTDEPLEMETSFDPAKVTFDDNCLECKTRYSDPKPKDLVMYLHAWKYKGPDWEYETKLPDWAKV